MRDILSILNERVRLAIVRAIGSQHEKTDPMIRPAANPHFGDYQANFSMKLAKQLRQNPRDLANHVVQHIDFMDVCEPPEVAGPGFINLKLDQGFLDRHLVEIFGDKNQLGVPEAEVPQTIVVDYSGPNVAKEMHVGHLRSTIIGDAIARVLDFQGHHVICQNHLGDWGTQFGMLIEHLVDQGVSAGAELPMGIPDLDQFYKEAKQRFDREPEFADRSRRQVVRLQSGDRDSVWFWQQLVSVSQKHFRGVYQRLGVLLTDEHLYGESSYNDQLDTVISALDNDGLLQESQGAKVVYPLGFTDRDSKPMPMIVQKSDCGYLYATTDLAAARYRVDQLHADRIIYVTDARQSQHFAMVFQTLRQAGWADESVRLDHVPFGAILGKDRKPFKTREGGTVKLAQVLDEAEQRAAVVIEEKNPELPEVQRKKIAHAVGIGALKYADLSNDRIKDYVFNWERMLALDGNTAPYLQNAFVRIRSIFRKAKQRGVSFDEDDLIAQVVMTVHEPAERGLALALLQFPAVIESVAESMEPHRLCTYLYELATAFHQFYEHCPVLGADELSVRNSRLVLCHMVAQRLSRGLDLLGIETVEYM